MIIEIKNGFKVTKYTEMGFVCTSNTQKTENISLFLQKLKPNCFSIGFTVFSLTREMKFHFDNTTQ